VTADHCLHEEFPLFFQRVVSVLEEHFFPTGRDSTTHYESSAGCAE
jgi:hypothetical protein